MIIKRFSRLMTMFTCMAAFMLLLSLPAAAAVQATDFSCHGVSLGDSDILRRGHRREQKKRCRHAERQRGNAACKGIKSAFMRLFVHRITSVMPLLKPMRGKKSRRTEYTQKNRWQTRGGCGILKITNWLKSRTRGAGAALPRLLSCFTGGAWLRIL